MRKGKEGRIKKFMQIALVVTEKRGFPLFHRVYPGNVPNRSIMGDIVKDLWMKGYTVVIMDRGMSDPGRIKSMLELKFTMICGLKKTPDLKGFIKIHGINTFNAKVSQYLCLPQIFRHSVYCGPVKKL